MCHALVIEDEPIIAFHIGDLIEQAGVTSVSYAQTELEAVSAAIEHRPSIIVSDVRLLTGTGTAAVTSIRAQIGRVPVIFITGNPEAVADYDHDGVLEKPFKSEQLKDFVRRFADAA